MKLLMLVASLFTLDARADILFFDTNFSPNEIVAAGSVAKSRGEKLFVFPERSAEQQRNMDKYYRQVEKLRSQVNHCTSNCDRIKAELAAAEKSLDTWVKQITRAAGEEIPRIFARLASMRANLTTIIYSGHSGGTGGVGGMLGGISYTEVQAALQAHPELFSNVRTMLLWGCYSGTLHSLHSLWQKTFPFVSVWGGFQDRSPLGIRESSGRFLKSFLLNENKLRAGRSLAETHRVFKSLDLVSELDGTALVKDSYFTYDHADTVEHMLAICNTFDPSLMETFTCYEEGRAGCENPPADHRGKLRDLYSFLQVNRHCQGALRDRFPYLPSLEYVVRLIYLDTIKQNFELHHATDFAKFEKVAGEAGLPAGYGIERMITSTRAEDIRRQENLNREFANLGIRDGTTQDRSNWHVIYQAAIASDLAFQITGPSGFRMVNYSCVPFSWVDPGSKERDECGLREALSNPLPGNVEASIISGLSWSRISRFQRDNLIADGFTSGEDLRHIKMSTLRYFANGIAYIESLPNPTAYELQTKDRMITAMADISQRSNEEVRLSTIEQFEAFILFLEQERIWAKNHPHGSNALWQLNYNLERIQQYLEILRRPSSPGLLHYGERFLKSRTAPNKFR